jgi:hypothetical protein
MTRLEPFDGVARLPMSKVSVHLENLSSFSAIKLDIWAQKTSYLQRFEAGVSRASRYASLIGCHNCFGRIFC